MYKQQATCFTTFIIRIYSYEKSRLFWANFLELLILLLVFQDVVLGFNVFNIGLI